MWWAEDCSEGMKILSNFERAQMELQMVCIHVLNLKRVRKMVKSCLPQFG